MSDHTNGPNEPTADGSVEPSAPSEPEFQMREENWPSAIGPSGLTSRPRRLPGQSPEQIRRAVRAGVLQAKGLDRASAYYVVDTSDVVVAAFSHLNSIRQQKFARDLDGLLSEALKDGDEGDV
jgi:hypothetical protein